jgi:Spy/CpxP family protein refolding chaperone
MLQDLLPVVFKGATTLSLLWSPKTLIASFSPPIPCFPLLSDLNLTIAQQQTLHTISLNAQARLKEILAPEQLRTYQSTLWQSRDLLMALEAMNLSDHQQVYLVEIFSHADQQIQALLTPRQNHQWDQLICDRMNSQPFAGLIHHQPTAESLSAAF